MFLKIKKGLEHCRIFFVWKIIDFNIAATITHIDFLALFVHFYSTIIYFLKSY